MSGGLPFDGEDHVVGSKSRSLGTMSVDKTTNQQCLVQVDVVESESTTGVTIDFLQPHANELAPLVGAKSLALRRKQYGVDDVNHTIRGVDIGSHDVGLIDA